MNNVYSKRKSAQQIIRLLWLPILLLSLVIHGCEIVPVQEVNVSWNEDDELIVHYIDVGQGDATLLQGPDFTVLIDTGRHDQNEVVPYLQQVKIEAIDLLIGTHPHADHIGQIPQVLQAFPVYEVWMSGDDHTSKTFERAIDAILRSDANYVEPRRGETYEIGSLTIEVLHPEDIDGNLNEGSIAARFIYGNIVFLFTGDAERRSELEMLKEVKNLKAHIFHLGHHGSSTSNTPEFLDAIQPETVIYSAGIDNDYGHPHDEVIEELQNRKIPIYGTDQHGTILVITDGLNYRIETER